MIQGPILLKTQRQLDSIVMQLILIVYMKRRIFFIWFLLGSLSLNSQSKQDYYWPFGNDKQEAPGVQGIEFDFNNRPFSSEIRDGQLSFDQLNASICDEDGNLLFYTNGCAVANRDHQIMPNGDSLNVGGFLEEFWMDCSTGYPGLQDIIILPDPDYEDGYFIFHKPVTYNPGTEEPFTSDSIVYTCKYGARQRIWKRDRKKYFAI